MNNIEKAKNYFILGEQYLNSAILLFTTMCRSGNKTYGIADNEKTAEKLMLQNSLRSDSMLLIPALFSSNHAMELYIKGLLILNNKNKKGHETSELLEQLVNTNINTQLIDNLNNFISSSSSIVEKFKIDNNINNQDKLYQCLRYPEKAGEFVNYYSLKYNGRKGIKEIKEILKLLKKVHSDVVEEYKQARD